MRWWQPGRDGFRRRAVVGALLAAASLAAGDARAWTSRIHGTTGADLIALDAQGNVFTTIGLPAGRYSATTAIVKLAARSGRQQWRRSLKVPGREHSDTVHALRLASDGDVVAAAGVEVAGQLQFTVVRVAGGNGRVRWRRAVRGAERPLSYEDARDVTIDPAGDVVAAGFVESALAVQYHGTSDFAVVKLSGDDGAERWRFVLDGATHQYDEASTVATDPAGDVIAAGTTSDPLSVIVVKLSGADGHLVWQRGVADAWRVSSIAVDPAGDALLAVSTSGGAGNDFGVVKVSGATGDPLWVAHVSGSDARWEEAFAVLPLPSGDVAAAGMTADAGGAMRLTAARLDGTTGEVRWQRSDQGTQGYGFGRGIALAPNGDVVVGGQVRNQGSCYDAVVERLAPSSGDVLASRMIDGRTQATTCDRTDCGGDTPGPCPPSRAGADQDSLSAVAVDPSDRIVVAGSLSDGHFGRAHGFVATFPSPRATR